MQEGVVDVAVSVGGMSASLASAFTYDASLSPVITTTSLASLSLYGELQDHCGTVFIAVKRVRMRESME